MKKIHTLTKRFLNSINTKIAIVFMLMSLATIEIIGAFFVRQYEQTSIDSFQTSIQIPSVIMNRISSRLASNGKNTDTQLNQIVSDYSASSAVTEIIVVDNKGVIRAVSNINKGRVGQRATISNIKDVMSTGRQSTEIERIRGKYYMVQATALTSGTGNNIVGSIYVRASMQSVFDQLRNVSSLFLSASIIAALLVASLSLFISRAITRPVAEIQQHAMKIADGDYSGQVHVYSNDELGQLADAFNTLSVRIEQSQEQSDSERRRLDSVLSHMNDGVLATDRHGNVIIINQLALNFLNLTDEASAINKPIAEVLGVEGQSSQDLVENNEGLMINTHSAQGSELILHASFSLIKRVTGFVSGAVCVLHDVTEQQRNEEEQKQFVSNVSHELRTPLTSMHAYIEALNDGAWKDPDIAPQFLEVTKQETERMIRMINDLLDLSRMDRGTVSMEMEWVNLNDFLNHVLDRFDMIVKNDRDQVAQKKYTIKREFIKQALWCEIDTDKMMQVVDNIMNNAIKYSPDGGIITVRLTQAQTHVILSISDQGLGIPRKDLAKIFDRFYRVDSARSREQGGTGLGLAIAKEIVEAHSGRIWADSAEGQGSTFYISLPYEPISEEDDWDEV